MARSPAPLNPWSLTSTQLAAECRAIAEGKMPNLDPAINDEAVRLYASWREALGLPGEDSRRAAQLSALRKRTIEILVHTRGAA